MIAANKTTDLTHRVTAALLMLTLDKYAPEFMDANDFDRDNLTLADVERILRHLGTPIEDAVELIK